MYIKFFLKIGMAKKLVQDSKTMYDEKETIVSGN